MWGLNWFESVLFPLGITDRLFEPNFYRDFLPEMKQKGVSIVAMKVYAMGRLATEGGDLERSLHYTMSLPISTMIIGMDSVDRVDENVSYVHSFAGMSDEEIIDLQNRTDGKLQRRQIWWKN
ncbi:MAG TPA: hypothetical protein VGB30_06120 [bacterium]|jgi:aryl-alcohol dehydrogenase-like predicted oxidoreductase